MTLFGPPNVNKLKAKGDIKGLIKALGYKRDQTVRQAAAEALGEIHDTQAVKPLVVALKDSDEMVRTSVAHALGEIASPQALDALIGVLEDAETRPRQTAVEALGKIRDTRAVEPLIAALMTSDKAVLDTAIDALGKIGPPAVESILVALKNPDLCKPLFMALGEIGDRRAVEPLLAAIDDDDASIRKVAVTALGKTGDYRVAKPLVPALWDPDWTVRESAFGSLEILGCTGVAVEPLIASLGDDDRRDIAVEFLKKMGAQVVKGLLPAYKNENRRVSGAATAVLATINQQAIEPLVDALKADGLRTAAADALAEICGDRAVDPLISVLDSWKWGRQEKKAASEALVKIGSRKVVEALTRLSEKKSFYAKKDADEALKRIAATQKYTDSDSKERMAGTERRAMSNCDLCAGSCGTSGKIYSREQIEKAAKAGLRPRGALLGMADAQGLPRDVFFQMWMDQVVATTPRWTLCDSCARDVDELKKAEKEIEVSEKETEKISGSFDEKTSLQMQSMDFPKALREEAAKIANKHMLNPNAADDLRSETQERMRSNRFRDALPYAIAEAIVSKNAIAVVRVGICLKEMANDAARRGQLNDALRDYVPWAIRQFNVVLDSGYEDSSVYTLRGSMYLLKAQLSRDQDLLVQAEQDFRKSLEMNPSEAEKADSLNALDQVAQLRERFFNNLPDWEAGK